MHATASKSDAGQSPCLPTHCAALWLGPWRQLPQGLLLVRAWPGEQCMHGVLSGRHGLCHCGTGSSIWRRFLLEALYNPLALVTRSRNATWNVPRARTISFTVVLEV